MKRVLTGLLLAALCGTAAADIKLTADNTKVEWTGTKSNGKHTGGFKTISGSVKGSDPATASIDVTFEMDSVYSDDAKLTNHLKQPDFFDVKTFKTASFKSTKIEKDGGKYKVTGDFTLCGKTKSITFPADLQMPGSKLTLAADFSINRLDYGCGASYPDGKIANKVALSVKVDAK